MHLFFCTGEFITKGEISLEPNSGESFVLKPEEYLVNNNSQTVSKETKETEEIKETGDSNLEQQAAVQS